MSVPGAIGGAITGALVGFSYGGPYGAIAGAVIGGVVGGYAAEAMTPDMPAPGTPDQQQLSFTANIIGSPISDLLGTGRITGTFIAFGKERTVTQYQETPGGKGGSEPDPAVTGYKYYATWAQAICMGPVDTLLAVYKDNDTLLWEGALNCPASGGEETITLEDVGSMTFYFGTDDQVAQSKMTNIISNTDYNSPLRGLCWAFFDDCYIGDYNRVPSIKFIIRKRPEIAFSAAESIGDFDYNPAHALYYTLNTLSGLSTDWLDSTDFSAIATTLSTTQRGISILFDQQASTLSYLENINQHIDAIMRYGFDGKFHPKLMRDDYVAATLPTIDEDVVLDIPTFNRGSWIDTKNETKVQYTKIKGAVGSDVWTMVADKYASDKQEVINLIVLGNNLYGASEEGGCLLKWNGTDAWTIVAPQLYGEEIVSLVVFNDKIYAGTQGHGYLYEWNGTDAWVKVADQLLGAYRIRSLVVYNNEIYGGVYFGGFLYKWNGTNAWVKVADQLNSQIDIYTMVVYNGYIYAGTYPNARLFRSAGAGWSQVANTLDGNTYISALCVFNNKLYGASGNSGNLYELSDSDTWVKVADEFYINHDLTSLTVYNDNLYGSVISSGSLYEWNGTDAWTIVAPQYESEISVYSLTVFSGKIYAGTWQSGMLLEWESSSTIRIKQSISNPYSVDVGNVNIQGRLVSQTGNMALFTNNRNSVWAARLLLRKSSYPFALVNVPVNRNMFRLEVGDCFKFTYAQYGISEMVFRILQVQEDGPESEVINIQASEDIYSVVNTITDYEDPEDDETEPPDYTVVPFTNEIVIEAPYALSSNIAVIPAASRASDYDLGFSLYMSVDDGSSYSLIKNISNIVPYGTLVGSYGSDTYKIDTEGFTIDFENDDVDLIETTTFANTLSGQINVALLGTEFISFQSITPVSGTQYSLTGVIRGRFGTFAQDHVDGEDFYPIISAIEYITNPEISAGVSRKFKLVPYNRYKSGDIADASVNTLTITGLSKTPYVPINFNANGSSYAARYDTDIVLTWSPRYRGKGAGIGIPGQVLSDDDREGLFEIEVWVSAALVRTTISIDAATWIYTSAMNTSDNGTPASIVTFKILNYRSEDGYTYESDQAEVVCYKNN